MRYLGILIVLSLTACGGGGGGSSNNAGGNTPPQPPPTSPPPPAPPPDPFGLTQRASLASFSFPDQSQGGSASVTLTDAFPTLSFSAAIFAAPVPGEARMVAVEQGGRIMVFDDNPAANTAATVLNISAQVLFSGEQGLLGLAFDPQFTQNRYVYVHYSAASPSRSVIARFTWDAVLDQIDPASEKVILENPQPFSNHNGGMLAFGPDGYLYIAFGDGGSGGDPNNEAQDRSTLHGNVLRLDVHPANDATPYLIPPDNPFNGQAGVLPEIYAWGLRNPFRFSFDAQTGDLWLGDVGQSEREEVNIITSGGNYGWRVFEGTLPFNSSGNTLPNSAFTPPVFEYDHSEGRSVIGGYVYRGNDIASLLGKYVFADYVSNNVWALTWDGSQVTQRETLGSVSNPTGFGQKADGELLVVSQSGSLFQIEQSGGGINIPDQLSDTGLFTDLSQLTPASGLIEYTVNHTFYSDGANKRRWIGVADGETVTFSDDNWELPVGSFVVKQFDINTPSGTRRLETRVLARLSDGWLGLTYRWNATGTDATLQLGRDTETLTVELANGSTRDQVYEYPSRTDCFVCHTDIAGTTLGLRTPQLNGDFDYDGVVDNQLRSWNNINLFNTDIGDPTTQANFPALDDQSASLEERARTYLDVNCAYCHQPSGPTQSNLDLRVASSNLNAIGVNPQFGDLGIADAELIASGNKEESVLWLRMTRRDMEKMPPLGTHVVDEAGSDLIGQWIDSL